MVLELALVLVIVFQQVYWSIQTHKLIDKLMSRNYHEYTQAERHEPTIRVKPLPDAPDDMGALDDFAPL